MTRKRKTPVGDSSGSDEDYMTAKQSEKKRTYARRRAQRKESDRPSTSTAPSSGSASEVNVSHLTAGPEHESTRTVISHDAGSESDDDFGGSVIRVRSRYRIPSQERDQPPISTTSTTSIAERRATGTSLDLEVAGLRLPSAGLRPPSAGLRPPSAGLRPPSAGLRPPSAGLRPPSAGLRPPSTGLRPLSGSAPRESLRQPIGYQRRQVRSHQREGRRQPSRSLSPAPSSSSKKGLHLKEPKKQHDFDQPSASTAPAPGFAPGDYFSSQTTNLQINDVQQSTPGPSTSIEDVIIRHNPSRDCRSIQTILRDSDMSDDGGDDSDGCNDDPDYIAPVQQVPRRSDYPRISSREHRARALRELLTSDSEDSDDIRYPEVIMGGNICQLGGKDNHFDIRCPWCGALDFKTIHKLDQQRKDIPNYIDPKDLICCDGGKVFIPPMRKRPVEIDELNEDRKTKENLVSYNTCFSYASLQWNKMPSAPFGLPVAKTMGPIRHFPSAAVPNDPSRPQFGNLYLYMGDEAVQLRMKNFSYLDKRIVTKLQTVLEKCHPFANTLRTMGSIMKEVQRSGEDDDLVRLKIVDARMVPKSWLQGHQGLYRDPLQLGESVALFYSATVEQDVKLPGLMIYPRKGRNTPMPIFCWDPRINTFCYPLFFPFGEYGHKYGGFKLAADPTESYENRLLDWAKDNPNIAKVWDINWSLEELAQRVHADPVHLHHRASGDPNVEIISDLSDGDEDDNVYDHLRHELESYEVNGSTERREVVERGGLFYPRQSTTGCHSNEDKDDDDSMANYEDDEQLLGIAHTAAGTSTRETAADGFAPSANFSTHATSRQIVDPSGDIEGDDLTAEQEQLDFIDAIEQEDNPIEPASIVKHTLRDHTEDSDEYSEDFDVGTDGNAHVSDVPNENWVRQLELDESEVAEVQHRKFATLRQWVLYSYQQRKTCADDAECVKNRFTSSGKLGQVYLLDLATRMYQMRHSFQRKHHTEYMRTSKTKFLKALQRRADRHNKTIGCVSTVPHTVAGSPRHLQNLFEHTVAMSRTRNGKPDLFITATANVNWPEIQNNLPAGEKWIDHPMVVNKVFKKKFEKLLDLIVGKRIEKGRAVRHKARLLDSAAASAIIKGRKLYWKRGQPIDCSRLNVENSPA